MKKGWLRWVLDGRPEIVARGVYERVEYDTKVSGIDSIFTSKAVIRTTVVYFIDGSTKVIDGVHLSMPFPEGTKIEIVARENGWSYAYSVREAEKEEISSI